MAYTAKDPRPPLHFLYLIGEKKSWKWEKEEEEGGGGRREEEEEGGKIPSVDSCYRKGRG